MTVGDAKPPIVLGAFDDVTFHEAIGKVGLAVGADAVGGVPGSSFGVVDGKGACPMVDAHDLAACEA